MTQPKIPVNTERYAQQMLLPEVGEAGQQTLHEARIIVIGAGGLGCAVLPYLAAAGVGQITVIDADVVELSNLHRQTLYRDTDIGQPKAQIAAQAVREINPNISVSSHVISLNPANVSELVDIDAVVLDCADNFAVSYTLSDYCLANHIALISASAVGMSGYVGGFCQQAPSLRAVFPGLPNNLVNCASAGVFGPIVGMIGCLQAQMTLSHILKLTPSSLGQLMRFDARSWRSSSFRFDGAEEPNKSDNLNYKFIASTQITDQDWIIDLREESECDKLITPQAQRINLTEIAELSDIVELKTSESNNTTQANTTNNETTEVISSCELTKNRLVVCCSSGIRAWRAADMLSQITEREIVLLAANAEN